MVDLQGQIVPENEVEWELLQRLYEVTGDAFDQGVETDEIVTSLAFVACSILATEDVEAVEPSEPPVKERRTDCPDCGEEIEDVRPFVGGIAEVRPCRCTVETAEVPGWFDV